MVMLYSVYSSLDQVTSTYILQDYYNDTEKTITSTMTVIMKILRVVPSLEINRNVWSVREAMKTWCKLEVK